MFEKSHTTTSSLSVLKVRIAVFTHDGEKKPAKLLFIPLNER
jgi:hypothetical protein